MYGGGQGQGQYGVDADVAAAPVLGLDRGMHPTLSPTCTDGTTSDATTSSDGTVNSNSNPTTDKQSNSNSSRRAYAPSHDTFMSLAAPQHMEHGNRYENRPKVISPSVSVVSLDNGISNAVKASVAQIPASECTSGNSRTDTLAYANAILMGEETERVVNNIVGSTHPVAEDGVVRSFKSKENSYHDHHFDQVMTMLLNSYEAEWVSDWWTE